ncbi:MAG: aldo/keto reductase [Clostridia bacterium]|nr:aldo/keto reductase [Clostridia bacterium]
MKVTEKNGYKISELTLGTVQLGIPYGINNKYGMPSDKQAADILQTAINGGIISFDTAKGYGRSEAVLGDFFKGKCVEKTLITKVEFENETTSEIKDSLFAKVKDSAEVMGVEKLPLVLLHSENYLDTYGQFLIDALKELKSEGLVNSVGISFSDKSKMIELTDPEIFDSVQIPANMFDNAEIKNGKIKELSDSGIAVYVRSVYLQGLFFMNTNTLPPILQSAKPALDKLHALAADNNLSMAALALSYMRAIQGITSLVLGCETPSQLEDSLSLFNMPLLSQSVVDRIMEISQEVEPVVIRPWEWNK